MRHRLEDGQGSSVKGAALKEEKYGISGLQFIGSKARSHHMLEFSMTS